MAFSLPGGQSQQASLCHHPNQYGGSSNMVNRTCLATSKKIGNAQSGTMVGNAAY
jgi:hypothetical protein